MSAPLTFDPHGEGAVPQGRAARLDQVLAELLVQLPEIEAAAVVSFDGLAMASALPAGMDEDRVAAMSAALLSLGEKAAAGLGRGDLSQVYVEGESGTVFLVSAEDEAVLVAVAAAGAKTGMVLYEIKRSAAAVAAVLAVEPVPAAEPEPVRLVSAPPEPAAAEPVAPSLPDLPPPLPAWPPAGYDLPGAPSAVVLPGDAPPTASGLAGPLAPVGWSPAPPDDRPADPWAG